LAKFGSSPRALHLLIIKIIEPIFTLLWLVWFLKTNNGKSLWILWWVNGDNRCIARFNNGENEKNTHRACMCTYMCTIIDCMLHTNFQFIVHWIVLAPEWISKGHEIFIYTKNDGVSKYSRQFFSPIYMIRQIVEKTACLL